MQSQLNKEIINRNINLILYNPQTVTAKEFIETYNIIYKHCTEITEHYHILGEEIYKIIAMSLQEFSKKLEFKGSIHLIAAQIHSFAKSIDLLQKIFAYLERFYIRTSIMNQNDVKKLKDLFFYEIYFNFIYRVEESLQSLILLEIETYRKAYKQDFEDLKTVITFYIECLRNNELETNKRRFFQRYFQDFKDNSDFNIEIGKLLKKIYLEMYFVTNILCDKDISKDVIQCIFFRKEEILEYVFELIKDFDKFKHIYVIITMMPENFKNQFKMKYEEFLNDAFANSHKFEDLYTDFMNVKSQIQENKLNGFDEILDDTFKKVFIEKSTSEQSEITHEMIKFIDGSIRTCNLNNHYEDADFNIIFDMFSLVFDEQVIGLYTESSQTRLLNGLNPLFEQKMANMILERVGWSNASILKNTVMSFINRTKLLVSYNEKPLLASYVKITKGFWNIDKNEHRLHPLLEEYKSKICSTIEIPERHKLEFNFRVSSMEILINNTKYKMNCDVVSLLLLIADNDSVDLNSLKEFTGDLYFDENVDFLIENGFVMKIKGSDNSERLVAIDKHIDEPFVDLLKFTRKKACNDEQQNNNVHTTHLLESMICKIMKRSKQIGVDLLKNEIRNDPSFENVLMGLVSKGYLEVTDDVVKYIP